MILACIIEEVVGHTSAVECHRFEALHHAQTLDFWLWKRFQNEMSFNKTSSSWYIFIMHKKVHLNHAMIFKACNFIFHFILACHLIYRNFLLCSNSFNGNFDLCSSEIIFHFSEYFCESWLVMQCFKRKQIIDF